MSHDNGEDGAAAQVVPTSSRNRDCNRNRALDAYRGLAIILMVFFTLILKLSSNLPDSLKHNVAGAFRTGDLVLPLFLFASGVSIAYFVRKYDRRAAGATGGGDGDGSPDGSGGLLRRRALARVGRLALVGVALSAFSARGLGEMDEVMLSALLFIATLALVRVNWRITLGLVAAINTSYLIAEQTGFTQLVAEHYLGGYYGAVYYLPVMLVGMLVGSASIGSADRAARQRLGWITAFVAGSFIVHWLVLSHPLDKLAVTPSFMMLSTLVALGGFIVARWVHARIGASKTVARALTRPGRALERLGRTPLRYWLLMYVIILIPLQVWVLVTGRRFPLAVDWPVAIVISAAALVALALVARAWASMRAQATIGATKAGGRGTDTVGTVPVAGSEA